jgi:peptidoglycan glycosyltransferase
MVLNMDSFKKKNSKFALIMSVACLSIFIGGVAFNVFEGKFQKLNAAEVVKDDKSDDASSPLPDDVKLSIDKVFREAHDWPQTIDINKKKAKIEYAFNEQLDAYIKKLLKSYRSDYATVAVIDNESGEVLAAVGVEGKTNLVDTSLVLNSTHPSASLIKMVTAAELLQNAKITRDTEFEFRGRSTTLFKYQLDDTKSNRWDKTQNFETAFAKSNNVIFGKAAVRNMTSDKLRAMAYNFGFNQSFIQELDFVRSYIGHATDDYRLAEIASGFNDETVISPIHAAMMASIVANNGIMKNPKVISKIVDAGNGELIWENTALEKRVLLPETTKEMREMMEMTVDGGTARKSFGKMNTGYKNALQMGGKTGSITGGKPFGKRDWFAAYAIPRDSEQGKGISISVMNVNVKRWHVKSTMLAKNIIEYYYNEVRPVPITMVQMPRMASGRSRKPRIYKRGVAISRSKKKEYASDRKRSNSKKEIGRRNERKSNTTI